MMTKIFILLAMLIILIALGSGLIFLVRDGGKSKRTVKALTWRIGISLALFIFLLIAFSLGLIELHSL
ncbi:twin transmembrane helix small protein [Legionella israelensis]|uniref:Twin transmembrane helix small protein n=1 Tax=Legionella israelensis TaxID=454 RepID=A0AAX1EJ53_9GAMM|nr:twin transmembrane helix small protein [Legionella israelensis]QBR85069.1 twin transmembrane helix small protein [Legionella israelensis]